MKKKILLLAIILTSSAIYSFGQEERDSVLTIQEEEKLAEIKAELNPLEFPVYKLYPTDNVWASLKLDTRNGRIWQVHFSISKDNFEGTLSINSYSLVHPEEEQIGRFNLYPTGNSYNFILLDQVNGNTYKVQWNNEDDKRFIRRIY